LITDILNYHPLTRGKLRNKEFVIQLYNAQLENGQVSEFYLQRKKVPVQPWRETGLPPLINSRVANLMTSTQFTNKSY
jgi:hypothetical protein